MTTIENLEIILTSNRNLFIKALKAAGYTDRAIKCSGSRPGGLLSMAVDIYADLWEAFDLKAFEATLKAGA